ncbi:hypothetical protein [Nannocystis radixulma]|uniref:Uncharacterized protein n=1 Tax=Nannocystis radixulma TaxID=2995305 RepID=A0ABT5BMN2_9BACT|nr:hypothetical protein [Nannocystis radixulma]MDC0675409.1 hypothetical protein [Nannocystis radixulma]
MMSPLRPYAICFSVLALAGCSDGVVVGEDATHSGTGSSTTSGDPPATTGNPSTTTTTADSPTGGLSSSSSGTTTGPEPTSTTTLDVLTTDATSTSTGDPGTSTTTGEPVDPLVVFDCADGVAWVRPLMGGVGVSNVSIVLDLVADADGNTIAVGGFNLPLNLGDGPIAPEGITDGFIAKYGPTGEHLWSRVYGGSGLRTLLSVDLDPDGNILVAGYFQETLDLGGGPLSAVNGFDGFVAKLSPEGDHLWSKSFGNTDADHGLSIASDSAGNVVLLAHAMGAVDFGAGPQGKGIVHHVVKFDPDGTLLWQRALGNDNPEHLARALAIDAHDDIVVVGEFATTVDFGGGPEEPMGTSKIYVAKFGPAGELKWFRKSVGEVAPLGGVPQVIGLGLDALGNIHMAGWFWGQIDFGGGLLPWTGEFDTWIATLHAEGGHLWTRGHGGGSPFWQVPFSVAANEVGDMVVSGIFEGHFTLGGDLFASEDGPVYIGRFGLDGSHGLSRAFRVVSANAVDIDDDGGIWFSGLFNKPFEIAGVTFEPTTPGQHDGYLIRLCP